MKFETLEEIDALDALESYEKYLYDITLDDKVVGDQGDESFDTEDEAREDAEDYIRTGLMKEHDRPFEAFRIECYVGVVVE